MTINKVAVIGAGVMGSSIAAHLANAGIPVLLLDLPHKEGRNKIVQDAIEKLKTSKPAALMDPKFSERIQVGNIEDDLEKLTAYDWVIEAVVEKVEIKRSLFKRIDEICDGKIIVTSNTSSIPLHDLTKDRSKSFQKKFLITHFFNPPRYMRLLEVITGKETDKKILEEVVQFADEKLGKGIVLCNDVPAFIGNRVGLYMTFRALDEALKSDLTIESIDALFNQVFKTPRTGIFALFDLMGLDVMLDIGDELKSKLNPSDPFLQIDFGKIESLFKSMIEAGYTGRKGKGGFYRLKREGDSKVIEACNLKTGEYDVANRKVKIQEWEDAKPNEKKFLEGKSPEAQYAWNVFSDILLYAVSLVPEVTEDMIYIDRAMKLGFNWKYGPFEYIDLLGPQWFREKIKSEGKVCPPLLQQVGEGTFYKTLKNKQHYLNTEGKYQPITCPQGVLKLSDFKQAKKPILENSSASLWDIGDGIVCLELTTKHNTIDLPFIEMLDQSLDLLKEKYKGMVIYNEGSNFCYGADINMFLEAALSKNWEPMEEGLKKSQRAMQKLKFSSKPVVSAPSGLALGGGCEVLLHSSAIVAHAELYAGLVEVGVGIVPTWGGCKEMLLREEESSKGGALFHFRSAFEKIALAKVSGSAYEAKNSNVLRESDVIVMNRDRVLYKAKEKALGLSADYKPFKEKRIKLPGRVGFAALKLGMRQLRFKDYDLVIGEKLAYVMTGGPTDILHKVSEQELYDLERDATMTLIKNEKTVERIKHILKTGKPLKN